MFENLSFRSRLLLWIMPILILGLLMLGGGTYIFVKNLIEKEFTSSMLTATGKTADGINTWLKTLLLEPETIASTGAARAINIDFSLIDAQNIYRHKILHSKYPNIFQDIYAANRYGEYHTVRNDGKVYSMFVGNIANRDYFKSIMAGGPSQITQPLVSRTTGIPTIFVVAPIKDDKDRPQGLIGAGISLNYIQVVAEGLKAYQSGYGIVVDKEGYLIYHPEKELIMKKKLTEFEDLTVRELGRRMMAGGSGTLRYIYKGKQKMAFYHPIQETGWSVATVVPEAELFESAWQLLMGMAVITILLTVLICLIIVVAAKRLTQPLLDLSAYAMQIASGNLTPGELKVRHHDEIGTVAEKFNVMAGNLKHMMENLGESESKFRGLVNNINVGIYRSVHYPYNHFIQVNPALVRMLGYETSEELLSIQIDDLYSNPDERRLISEQIISKGFVKDREFRFLRKDGLSIWCSVTASAEYDENGGIKWTNGFVEEITERKRLAEQLRQSQKMEAIGTLAGGIAHDFNNILTAVTGYATLARMQAEDGTRISGYVDSILEGTERATHLTRSLLTFSRKQHVSLNPVDLNGIVRRMEQFLRRVIGEDIEFRTDLSSESLIVLADSGQIEQVLMNLATNARDAMRKGGIIYVTTEKVDIKKATPGLSLKQGEYAMLAFSDAGQGMSESVRQRIFEPFFTTKEVGKGTGLGLSIVYGIVKQHDGDIYVYSEPGSGTTFKIYLKLISSSPLCLDEADSCEIAGGTEAVLIAEDDIDVRRLFREVLENLGYKVIEAADGEEAVARYIEHQDDIKLLLFDVIMPKKNGKEAFEEIRKINQKIKIIFSSGYTADIINHKGFGEDYANLISKPISPAGLAAKVREVLDKD